MRSSGQLSRGLGEYVERDVSRVNAILANAASGIMPDSSSHHRYNVAFADETHASLTAAQVLEQRGTLNPILYRDGLSPWNGHAISAHHSDSETAVLTCVERFFVHNPGLAKQIAEYGMDPETFLANVSRTVPPPQRPILGNLVGQHGAYGVHALALKTSAHAATAGSLHPPAPEPQAMFAGVVQGPRGR